MLVATAIGTALSASAVIGFLGGHRFDAPATVEPTVVIAASRDGGVWPPVPSTEATGDGHPAGPTGPTDRPDLRDDSGPPVALDIPVLDVQARVVPIEPDGATLVPPADPATIGWWDSGVHPGAGRGRVVLTGHTVSSGGGAFDRLRDVLPGDRVTVTTPKGKLQYRVESVLVLSIAAVADRSAELFGTAGPERLALVTCTDWDGVEYLGNTVVVAAPEARGRRHEQP